MTKLKKIWTSKWKILEGLWYNHVVFVFNKKHWAMKIVKQRRAICAVCPLLDKEGTGKNVILKGKPACSICGCSIRELTSSLSSDCSTIPSKWEAVNRSDDYKLEAYINTKDLQDDQIH